jgi:hypothetical protein
VEERGYYSNELRRACRKVLLQNKDLTLLEIWITFHMRQAAEGHFLAIFMEDENLNFFNVSINFILRVCCDADVILFECDNLGIGTLIFIL